MQYFSQITGIRETEKGTDLILHIPGEWVQSKIIKYRNNNKINAEIRIDDGRTITADQRKKIFATVKDIALLTGEHPEELRAWLLYDYCIETGEIPFSLSNCSISQAREFITFIIDFILKHGIPLSDEALNRTDDIDRYLWGCLKYSRCCICGRKGEMHHWNAIGMGRDRSKIDDSDLRKIQLCREHHTEAHAIGRDTFGNKYHVYGILYEEE
ncbi:putative HNHc nuclease [Tissierella sp. MB52-C2]|uniref:putative HNHc nuclease n=1 Tax=Tissierella sp. MB52-C2 TaxID=3070999 RepID=UPI00280A9EA7|nr:putative HNHc nuclease [Tissierella sp. MB52-C2]WMM24067.1 putative HNHc nuclease [Tissierella sp. MB52-C2]